MTGKYSNRYSYLSVACILKGLFANVTVLYTRPELWRWLVPLVTYYLMFLLLLPLSLNLAVYPMGRPCPLHACQKTAETDMLLRALCLQHIMLLAVHSKINMNKSVLCTLELSKLPLIYQKDYISSTPMAKLPETQSATMSSSSSSASVNESWLKGRFWLLPW